MRHRLKVVPRPAGMPGQGDMGSSSGEPRNHTASGTTSDHGCYCGGPGGRPGMSPICVRCLTFRLMSDRRGARLASPAWATRPRLGV